MAHVERLPPTSENCHGSAHLTVREHWGAPFDENSPTPQRSQDALLLPMPAIGWYVFAGHSSATADPATQNVPEGQG